MTSMGCSILAAVLSMPLQADEEEESARAAVADFKKSFTASGAEDAERLEAIRKLGETRHAVTASALAGLLSKGPVETRIGAAKALEGFSEVKGTAKRIGPALFHPGNLKSTEVRMAFVAALKALGQSESLPFLHRLIEDRDILVAKEALLAIPSFRRKASIPSLIAYLKVCEKVPGGLPGEMGMTSIQTPDPGKNAPNWQLWEQMKQWDSAVRLSADQRQGIRNRFHHKPTLDALRSLTGENFIHWKDWNAWWAREGAAFRVDE